MTTLSRVDGDLWMEMRDPNRFARKLKSRNLSHRQVADALGWKSHSYVGRLARGEVKTMDPESALRIAKLLDEFVDDLFVICVSTPAGRNGQDEAA